MGSKATRDLIALQALLGAITGYQQTKQKQREEAKTEEKYQQTLAQQAIEAQQKKADLAFQRGLELEKLRAERFGLMENPNQPGTFSQQRLPGQIGPEQYQELLRRGQSVYGPGFGLPVEKPGTSGVPQIPKAGAAGGGAQSEYGKVLAREAAKEISAQEGNIPKEAANQVLFSRMKEKLGSGEYNPGPLAGRSAPVTQPAFQSDINAIRGVAISELGKYFKGAMSDRDVKLMVDSVFDPNLDDPNALKQGIDSLSAISHENRRQIEAKKAWGAAHNGDFTEYRPPDPSPESVVAIQALSRPRAVLPGKKSAPSSGWTPEKEARYQELKRKVQK